MFLAKVLSLRMILSVEGLGITTFDTFLSKNERMRGGRFRVRVGASSSSLFAQRRIAVFSAICMTLLFG